MLPVRGHPFLAPFRSGLRGLALADGAVPTMTWGRGEHRGSCAQLHSNSPFGAGPVLHPPMHPQPYDETRSAVNLGNTATDEMSTNGGSELDQIVGHADPLHRLDPAAVPMMARSLHARQHRVG
jgi:hypothetical protein